MKEPNTDNLAVYLIDKDEELMGIVMPTDGMYSAFDENQKYVGTWETQFEAVQESRKTIKWDRAFTEPMKMDDPEMLSFCDKITVIEE